MSQKYATLDDIARAADMSRTQVSRALRGDPGVKPRTRERVMQIASQLGYRPNVAAQSLASAQSKTVGLVIGEPMNPFHIQLAQAVDAALVAAGLDPMVSLRALDDESALREADRLISMRAAGAILIGTPHSESAITEMAKRLPCVYIGKKVKNPGVSTVSVDDKAGVEMLIRLLVTLGHSNIAHIRGGTEAAAEERLDSYQQVMIENGLTPMVFAGGSDADAGRRGVDALIAHSPAPTAIFAYNDFMACGAINRLYGLGKRVPDDISVVGFDDIPAAASETLSITTLRQNREDQATKAVRLLLELMKGESVAPQKILVPVELMVRRSVTAPRVTTAQ